MKKVLIGLALFVVVVIAVLLAVPFLIDLNAYQDRYRPLIEKALNRNVKFDSIRLTIVPRLGARISGFTVLDDPAFSSGAFASLASLDIGIKLMPLLTGRVDVEEIVLKEPRITVIKNAQGVLNVSTLGAGGPAAAEEKRTPPEGEGPLRALALLAVDQVLLTDGRLTYQDRVPAPPVEYRVEQLNVRLESVRLGERARIHLDALVQPSNVPVALDGTVGPLVESLDLKAIDLMVGAGKVVVAVKGRAVGGRAAFTVTAPLIDTADLPVSLPLTRPVQIKDLLLDAEADYRSNKPPLETATIKTMKFAAVAGRSVVTITGSLVGGEATMTATAPVVNTTDVPIQLPLKKPIDVTDVTLQARLKGERATVETLSFRLFGGQVTARTGVTIEPRRHPFEADVHLQGVQLGPALAAVNDNLAVSGTAGARVQVDGRGFSTADLTAALHGSGLFTVKDGKIEGVNVLQEAAALLKAVGVTLDPAKATVFNTIDGEVSIKDGQIRITRLIVDSHDFHGTATGTIGFDQRLNLKAALTLSEGLSKQMAAGAPAVRLAMTGGRLTVPMVVTGTAQAPAFGLDGKAVAGKVEQRVKEQVKETLDDVLKGKKIDLDKGLKRLFGE
ncbi:type II secretion system protein GspN [Candidatus Nitrospira bockiana]